MKAESIAADLTARIRTKLQSRTVQVVWSQRLRRFVAQRADSTAAEAAEPWRIVGCYTAKSDSLYHDLIEDLRDFQLHKQKTTG